MATARRWKAAFDLATAQAGPVAVRQLVALGIPRSTIHDRITGEGWQRPFRGVVVPPGLPVDQGTRTRAAALAIGPHAIITGASALLLHGVADQPPLRPQLVVPWRHRTPRCAGASVARTTTLRSDDAAHDRGVLLATVSRALLDAAARAGTDRLRSWLVDGRQRRLVDPAAVLARANASPGVRGRSRLVRACSDADDSAADSALAAEVERLLRSLGFELDVPARTVEVPGRVLHPDLTLRGLRIAVEVDGFGAHASRRGLDLDQRKHNAYSLAGWTVLRIGWDRLRDDWDGFVAELRWAVARANSAA